MQNKIVKLLSKPQIEISSSVVGKKEKEGPLSDFFDLSSTDERFGMETFEQAESEMVRMAFEISLKKTGLRAADVDLILGGDLQNQCIAQSFGLASEKTPYVGLYGACSNMAEELLLGGILVDSSHFSRVACSTSSHFAASERQFRFPLEYGCQRPPTSQNTVTGAASVFIAKNTESKVYINECLPGIITDAGIKDANNMGAAMAGAAFNTMNNYFVLSDKKPSEFDLILTGDLGIEGSDILREIAGSNGLDLGENYNDCGNLIYDPEKQDVHSGGSGCGCSGVVLAGYVMDLFVKDKIRDILFVGTGALLSPSSVLQKLTIPGIAHLVRITKAE